MARFWSGESHGQKLLRLVLTYDRRFGCFKRISTTFLANPRRMPSRPVADYIIESRGSYLGVESLCEEKGYKKMCFQ